MMVQFARNALTAFRSSDPESGVQWMCAFVARYTDTRTASLVDAVKRDDYEVAVEILELTLSSLA